MQMKFLAAIIVAAGALNGTAADSVVVQSRKPDGTLNTPAWSEIGGKWNSSKNKTRVPDSGSLIATNVSVAFTNSPVPAFRVMPSGLEPGARYNVEVTFGSTASHAASSDLVVAVRAEGVSANTIPPQTKAFQQPGSDQWNLLGTITPSTNSPALTFTYVGGALSRESRWYADTVRFTREVAE